MNHDASQSPRSTVTRRRFLQHTSLGALALSLSPRALRGASGANDRISIGMIGTGDRAQALLLEILRATGSQNVQVTAVCDVWKKNRESTAAKVAASGNAPRTCSRFQELLALPDVDAVVIATPDFGHTPILLEALAAGKDVYVEKPMSLELTLANQALALARAKQRIVQVGTQRRSDGRHLAAAQAVTAGMLGKLNRISVAVHFNHARWARPYADCLEADVDWPAFLMGVGTMPFDAKLLRRWQLYRFCTNGIPGLWLPHFADLVCFLTGAKYPSRAVSLGGNYVWQDGREHPDTFHTVLEYPEGFLFDFAMDLGNAAGSHFRLHGTEATLDMDNWTITPEGGTRDKPAEPRKLTGVQVTPHMENWLESLRSRKLPAADIQFGQQQTVAVVMSARAQETGRRQQFDPVTQAIVSG
ncbi:MAG: Gfo/Idh/MocA family oxidoreductase [Verrucomicrobiae bacterium]|nr:Gfo/Idh/MocA family oxidoreductase [Verrucomicrobiae bacterium]